MSKLIRELEERIARQLATDLIAAGFVIDVNDGEKLVLAGSTDVAAILAAMWSTDEDQWFLFKDGKRGGWARFIYGNDGWDVISDYTVNLEPHMAGANAISEKYQ